MTLATGYSIRDNAGRTTGPRAGFTLVELVLVMLLLAVVLAYAAPTLSRFTDQRTLEDETTRFLALTRFARNEAVSLGLPIVLWIDPLSQRYGLDALLLLEPRAGRLFDHALHPKLTLSVVETSTRIDTVIRLTFLPDGTLGDSTPVTLQLEDVRGHRLYVTRSENGLTFEILREQDYVLRLEQTLRTTTRRR